MCQDINDTHIPVLIEEKSISIVSSDYILLVIQCEVDDAGVRDAMFVLDHYLLNDASSTHVKLDDVVAAV